MKQSEFVPGVKFQIPGGIAKSIKDSLGEYEYRVSDSGNIVATSLKDGSTEGAVVSSIMKTHIKVTRWVGVIKMTGSIKFSEMKKL